MRAVTWNLRNAHPDPGHEWSSRAPLVAAVLADLDPDVLCVQEALPRQLDDVVRMLPHHVVVGRGRDADGGGEATALALRRDALDVDEWGAFWLSDRPDEPGSIGWGASLTRLAVWARAFDRTTGTALTFAGTHTDHDPSASGDAAREASTRLIAERLSALPAAGVLLGDFNEDVSHGAAARLVEAGWRDAWTEADAPGEPTGTFHGYGEPDAHGDRIDWILVRGPIRVRSAHAVLDDERVLVASDHLPVVAELEVGARR